MNNYINEKEVAKMTGLAVQTLRNMRHERRGFPYIKISRAIRYDPRDVEEYIQKRRIDPEGGNEP